MSGSPEGLRLGGGVCKCPDGSSSIRRRDTGGTTFEFIDGDGEGRTKHRGIVGHLMHEVQFGTALLSDRATQDTSSVLQHKIDFVRRDLLRGDDEIAFVLTIFIVHYDDELSLAKVV